jgi:glycosyltransferase involved in cell wall biosynthesis
MQDDIVKVYKLDVKKTSVIYNPVNQIIEKHILKYGIESKKEGYLLCVGRLESQKSIDYSIIAFSNVLKKFPNLRLKILGEGSLKNELIELTKMLEVNDKVDFIGFNSDVITYYSKAEATILSSLYEGFPNVLIESISLGTPVVSFDCKSGPNEIIENGINGYLVNYLDVNDLESKILLTLNKRWNYKLVAESAYKFRLDLALDNWETLLKN